jgi:cullin-associated NEDD8-dissociated protein 1
LQTEHQAFESLLLRCPTEICAHVPRLMQLAQWYLTYDPNYTNQDDAGMEDGGWGAASASASSSSSNKMKSDWDEEPEEDEAANDAAWDDDVAYVAKDMHIHTRSHYIS